MFNLCRLIILMQQCVVMQCVANLTANGHRIASQNDNGLYFDGDDNNHLIGIDLSHLNLIGKLNLRSLPQTVRSLDLSFNDLTNLNFGGLNGKSLQKLNIAHNERCYLNVVAVFEFESGRNIALQILEFGLTSEI